MAEPIRSTRWDVTATCVATVREFWVIESAVPLTEEEAREAMTGETPEGVTLRCGDEEIEDEQDRQIEKIEALDADGETIHG